MMGLAKFLAWVLLTMDGVASVPLLPWLSSAQPFLVASWWLHRVEAIRLLVIGLYGPG